MIEVSLGNTLVRPAPCSECLRVLNEQQKPCKALWIKMLFSHLPLSFQHETPKFVSCTLTGRNTQSAFAILNIWPLLVLFWNTIILYREYNQLLSVFAHMQINKELHIVMCESCLKCYSSFLLQFLSARQEKENFFLRNMQGVNRLLGRSPSKLNINQYKETKR